MIFSEAELELKSWFLVELIYLIYASFFYLLGFIYFVHYHQLQNTRKTMPIALLVVAANKIFYYSWALDGAIMYFARVRHD